MKHTFLEVRQLIDLSIINKRLIRLETVPVNRHDFARRTTLLWERITSMIGLPGLNLVAWFRLSIVWFLLKIKQTNDGVLNRIQQQPLFAVLPQRLLIYTGAILDYLAARLQPTERPESKQPTRPKQFVSR